MSTGTFGNTATPASGFVSRGDGTNQVWSQFAMPVSGYITTLHAYFGTFAGGTATCQLCVWDANGNLLGSAAVSVPQKPSGAGAQQWNAASPGSPIFVPAGTCYLGFWTPSANGFSTSSENGGASSMKAAGGSPANLSGGVSTGVGALGAYADYATGNARKLTGPGTWGVGPANVDRNGTQTPGLVSVMRNGGWVQAPLG